jgi:hypothetical protein
MSVVERVRKEQGKACVSSPPPHPVGLKMRPKLRKLKRQIFNLEHVKVLKKGGTSSEDHARSNNVTVT